MSKRHFDLIINRIHNMDSFMQISHPVYSIYHPERYPYKYTIFVYTAVLNLPPLAQIK
jgi:hypothetical protein